MTLLGPASIRGVPFFVDLSEGELSALLSRALTVHYKPQQMIFNEGDRCEGLYVIVSGKIKVFRVSPDGREQILTIQGSGTSVAELPVFDDGDYPASAAAITEATLLHIRKQDFRALCLEQPEVALKVLKQVGSRLRRLVEIIDELSFSTVRHRLTSLLLRLAAESGERTGQGIVFTLPGAQQDLAAQIGTVRELISRNLGRLQSMGIIRIDGKKRVTVLDLQALKAEAADGK